MSQILGMKNVPSALFQYPTITLSISVKGDEAVEKRRLEEQQRQREKEREERDRIRKEKARRELKMRSQFPKKKKHSFCSLFLIVYIEISFKPRLFRDNVCGSAEGRGQAAAD